MENTNLINYKKDNKNYILEEGKKILKENIFFNDLDNLMNDQNFKKFYDNYLNNFNDIKVVILYIKLYETIKSEYRDRYNLEINKELLIYMIRELMTDKNSRKMIFDSFHNFTEGNNNSKKKIILDIFENKNKKIFITDSK